MVRSKFSPSVFHPFVFFVVFLSVFFLLAHRFSVDSQHPSSPRVVVDQNEYANILVTYVYDGDTIKLSNGEKIRLEGIDTPESRKNNKLLRDAKRSHQDVDEILRMGRAASEYVKSLLTDRRVRLEFDIQQRDKYGRLLAYVYRLDDGLFINQEIIKNGYAYPLTIPPNLRYADRFKEFFREARKQGLGLWGKVS